MPHHRKISAIFFGSDNFAKIILHELLNSEQFTLQAVVTPPDKAVGRKKIITPSPVKILAQEKKIPVWQPIKLTASFIQQLKKYQTDIFIVAAYGKILPLSLISLPRYKTINLHPSLLPKYRGPAPIQNALLNGETATGTSLMLLDKKMDHGPIISQATIAIEPQDNYLSLAKKLARLSAQLLIKNSPDYITGAIKPQPQQHNEATYTKIIQKEDGLITNKKTATQIYNMWRAYINWPGIYGNLKTKQQTLNIKLLDIALDNLSANNKPLLTLFTKDKQLYLSCAKRTYLKINQLQVQNKQATDAKNFINGYLK